MTKKWKVLLLETIADPAHRELCGHATIHLLAEPDEEPPESVLAEADAIVTRGRGRVTAALLDQCPRLRVVARCGVGLDNVDVDAATARGIRVLNAPGSTTATTAEHTLMLILALQRNLYGLTNAVKSGDWQVRTRYTGDECNGKTLGVVGLGSIGSRVAKLASALGMHVVTHNRTERDLRFPLLPIEELLGQSDIVTLHTALCDETRHLIDTRALAGMKSGALLVNAARGGLVDTESVLNALDSGQLNGYAADGVEDTSGAGEDLTPTDRLLRHPRTLITPHAAALTGATYHRTCSRTVKNVLDLLEGKAYESEALVNSDRL
ncbi:MAG: NAD(P)-dependent oxidoreductase [Planctomycetota bacterium]